MNRAERVETLARALLASLGGGRDVYMGSRHRCYEATFIPDNDPVQALRAALDAPDEAPPEGASGGAEMRWVPAEAWFQSLAEKCFKIAWREGKQARLIERIKHELIVAVGALPAPPSQAAAGPSETVWIGRMGSAEEMLGRFCTIGKFDPAERPWAFHYHSSKDAAQTFAKSMTEHGSPAIVIEVVEYYASETHPSRDLPGEAEPEKQPEDE